MRSMSKTPPNPPFFRANSVSKSFGEVTVLKDIDLQINQGEVLALLGENGAGKSTLVKLIGGYENISSGELALFSDSGDEQPLPIDGWNHSKAESAGVILIHQELNLAEQLNAVENIFLGNEISKGGFLNQEKMLSLTQEYLSILDCDIDASVPVKELPVSVKQMIEIAKAYAKESKLLILDEPTAVLTGKESEVLFQLINRLTEQGVAIVYISHKLDEIERIADRVVILRDGQLIGDYEGSSLSKDDMARLMVGRELSNLFPPIPLPSPQSEILLELNEAEVAGSIKSASFTLRAGEVLGFAGLVGSGRTALMEAIIGINRFSPATDFKLRGKSVRFNDVAAARQAGIAYLTKDRKESGLLLNMNLPVNFSLFALHKFSNGLINTKQENAAFMDAVETFEIRLKDLSINAGNLSGGNQQKLLLAKVMAAEPSIIIIDEPTRGIDIGTKSQIYHFIAQLAQKGHGIIVVSSDMMEVIGISQRVAVMCQGSLVGILEGEEKEEHEIMRYAAGLKSQLTNQGEKASA
ncbi:MAG: sugar ABC transporter ATP-binding protein [Pseudohongiellaceae bacterium]